MGKAMKPKTSSVSKEQKVIRSDNSFDYLKDSLACIFREEIQTLKELINTLRAENTELGRLAFANKKVINLLQAENGVLKNEINILNQSLKNYSVRIYGIPESPREGQNELSIAVFKLFKNKLNISILKEDIDDVHRIGKVNWGKSNRCVLLTFVKKSLRDRVLRFKKNFRGSDIVVVEDLTSANLNLLKEVRKCDSVQNAWTINGICDNGYVPSSSSGTCIKVYKNPILPWVKARARCQEDGADLVTIFNSDMNHFIDEQSILDDIGVLYFIGLHKGQSWRFQWLDDPRQLDYTALEPGPFHQIHHCAVLDNTYYPQRDIFKMWLRKNCSVSRRFIFEKYAAPISLDCSKETFGMVSPKLCGANCKDWKINQQTGCCVYGCSKGYEGPPICTQTFSASSIIEANKNADNDVVGFFREHQSLVSIIAATVLVISVLLFFLVKKSKKQTADKSTQHDETSTVKEHKL